MVWDPPKQEVNVTRIIIYSFIPILSIYAGWRIQKFWLLVGINFLFGIITILSQMFLPFPYGLFLGLGVEIGLSAYVVRHFAKKYNEKITKS